MCIFRKLRYFIERLIEWNHLEIEKKTVIFINGSLDSDPLVTKPSQESLFRIIELKFNLSAFCPFWPYPRTKLKINFNLNYIIIDCKWIEGYLNSWFISERISTPRGNKPSILQPVFEIELTDFLKVLHSIESEQRRMKFEMEKPIFIEKLSKRPFFTLLHSMKFSTSNSMFNFFADLSEINFPIQFFVWNWKRLRRDKERSCLAYKFLKFLNSILFLVEIYQGKKFY